MNKLLAEALGTFVLVFGGAGAAVLAGEAIGVLGIAFAFGLSLLVMAYAIGPISGCHINPAVTLGVLMRGKMSIGDAIGYWIVQIIGGLAGGAVLLVIAKGIKGGYDAAEAGFAANGFGAHSPTGFSLASVFTLEVVLTAMLVFTVLAATDRIANTAFAGIPIGFVLVLVHLVGIPVSNTSVNPARSIAVAPFQGGWAMEQLWVFIAAPLVGAVVGGLLHLVIFSGAEPVDAGESAVAKS